MVLSATAFYIFNPTATEPDVKVVTPYGEIPWNEVSRFNDDEIKLLMKEVVNKLYSFLHAFNNLPGEFEPFIKNHKSIRKATKQHKPHLFWDEPKLDNKFIKGYLNFIKEHPEALK